MLGTYPVALRPSTPNSGRKGAEFSRPQRRQQPRRFCDEKIYKRELARHRRASKPPLVVHLKLDHPGDAQSTGPASGPAPFNWSARAMIPPDPLLLVSRLIFCLPNRSFLANLSP